VRSATIRRRVVHVAEPDPRDPYRVPESRSAC
jgi:hypothetical protein